MCYQYFVDAASNLGQSLFCLKNMGNADGMAVEVWIGKEGKSAVHFLYTSSWFDYERWTWNSKKNTAYILL